MNGSCELQAVVLSTDSAAVDSLCSCLNTLGISPALHREVSSAIGVLSRQKTDAFFVDHELDSEFALLKGVRGSPSSRGALGFALVPQKVSPNRAFRLADFVIDKPLAETRLIRTLRAAYGIMLKERMRYFRHSVEVEATLVDRTQRTSAAQIRNISQTGLAIVSPAQLIARESVQLHFCLPGDKERINCKAQIIWTADSGKAGLAFTHLAPSHKLRLTEWIESKFLSEWQPVVSIGATQRLAVAGA